MLSLPVLDIFLDENIFLNGANKRESRRGEDPVSRASEDPGSSLAGPGSGRWAGEVRQFPVPAQWGQSSANGAHIQSKCNKDSEGPKDVVHCHQVRGPPRVSLSPSPCAAWVAEFHPPCKSQ